MRVAPLILLPLLFGCPGQRPAEPPAPRAEFLLWAGDSTFWVRSAADGIRVRGSPLLLARYGGRFFEIFIADDDQSYYDAILVGQRIFRRDLMTGDSAAVFGDTLVAQIARRYGEEHPAERPLGPEEEGSDDPRTVATAELEILDLFGPFLIFEQHTDVEVAGGDDWHSTRRGAVDLRTGRPATVATLFGDSAGRRILAAGRRHFSDALDSILTAADERARRAAGTLGGFDFDEGSFTLVRERRQPAVAFLVPGAGDRAGGLVLHLPPIAAGPAAWWPEVDAGFPSDSGESTAEHWPRRGHDVLARFDANTDRLLLTLRDSGADRREWRVASLPAPARRLFALDDPPIDQPSRAGLERAFDESARYSEHTRVVRFDRRHPRPRPRRAALVRHASVRAHAPLSPIRQR